jgi:hypothetical protein
MSETKLTEEQHKLVNYILAQGVLGERDRILSLINAEESDTISKENIIKLISEE